MTLEHIFVWSGGNMVYECDYLTPTQGIVYVYGINLISSRDNSRVEKLYLYNAHHKSQVIFGRIACNSSMSQR